MALILHLIPNYISEILFLVNCNLIIKTGGISDFNDSVHLKNYDGNSEPCVIITCQKKRRKRQPKQRYYEFPQFFVFLSFRLKWEGRTCKIQ